MATAKGPLGPSTAHSRPLCTELIQGTEARETPLHSSKVPKTSISHGFNSNMKSTVETEQTAGGGDMEGTYCSFRSVNCFSRVVISSRHSILLLSQSSLSISVHKDMTGLPSPPHHMCCSIGNGTQNPRETDGDI